MSTNTTGASNIAGPGVISVVNGHRDQQTERDQEIDDGGPDRRERHGEPGEINLGDQTLGTNDAIARAGDRRRKERPREQARVDE